MYGLTTIVGWMAFITSASMLVPQVIKVLKTRSAKGISLYMFILAVLNYSFWITYGFLKNDYVIYIPNILAFSSSLFILVFIIRDIIMIKKENKEEKQTNMKQV